MCFDLARNRRFLRVDRSIRAEGGPADVPHYAALGKQLTEAFRGATADYWTVWQ